jgi:hypothetical protein
LQAQADGARRWALVSRLSSLAKSFLEPRNTRIFTKIKTNKKIDKLDVFIRIVNEVFDRTITEEDKKILIGQVEYLLTNNKIKILDPFIIWGKQVFNWVKSKII